MDSSRQLSLKAKKRVAIHEAGHTLVGYHLLGPDSIEHLSVIPAASGSLGAAYLHRQESLELPDAESIRKRLAVLMGGRVAEMLCYPVEGPSCGAENDIREATRLAQDAVGTWGLDPEFPLVSMEVLSPSLQQALAAKFLALVQNWLNAAESRAAEELALHRNRLDSIAQRLVLAETLHRAEILEILAQRNP